jgi:hypothetical protein
MADPFVFTPIKHKVGWYFEQARDLPATELGCLLLLEAGLPSDDVLQDYTSIAALLAGPADEATFVNYTRKVLPAATVTIDLLANRVVLSAAGSPVLIQWDNAGAGGPPQIVAEIVFYYLPAVGTADTGLIPLAASPMRATADGTHLLVRVTDQGIARVRNPT